MNPMELFNQVKEMIEKKDFEAAKAFVVAIAQNLDATNMKTIMGDWCLKN